MHYLILYKNTHTVSCGWPVDRNKHMSALGLKTLIATDVVFRKVLTLFQPLLPLLVYGWGSLSVHVLNRWSLCWPICQRESSCPADVVFITSECFSSCCFPVVCGLCYVTSGTGISDLFIYCYSVWVCAEVSVTYTAPALSTTSNRGACLHILYPFKVHPFLFKVHHSEDKKRKPSLHDIS